MTKVLDKHSALLNLAVILTLPLWSRYELTLLCVAAAWHVVWLIVCVQSLKVSLHLRTIDSLNVVERQISAQFRSTITLMLVWIGVLFGKGGNVWQESGAWPFLMMALFALVAAGLLLAVQLRWTLSKHRTLISLGQCLNCGYDLTATDAEVCPECGVRKEKSGAQVATSPKPG